MKKKAGNLALWIIISVLAVTILYNVYNRFVVKAQLDAVKPRTSSSTEDKGKTDKNTETKTADESKSSEDKNDGKTGEGKETTGENKTDEKNEGAGEKIMAPDFTLEDINGKKVSLSDYRGKIVFLNFWATWCQYCVMEMPDLEEVHKEFSKRGDAVVLTVNSDSDPDLVRDFLEQHDLTLPVLMDYDNEVNWMYAVTGIPVTYVIDRDGSVLGRIPGMTKKEIILEIFESIR